jgi:hypothetical protein
VLQLQMVFLELEVDAAPFLAVQLQAASLQLPA